MEHSFIDIIDKLRTVLWWIKVNHKAKNSSMHSRKVPPVISENAAFNRGKIYWNRASAGRGAKGEREFSNNRFHTECAREISVWAGSRCRVKMPKSWPRKVNGTMARDTCMRLCESHAMFSRGSRRNRRVRIKYSNADLDLTLNNYSIPRWGNF